MATKKMTTQQVAEMYGVSRWTVRRWIAQGQLRALRLPNNTIRIERVDAEALYKLFDGTGAP